MWPGCNQCGAAVPALDDLYCGGNRCVGKGKGHHAGGVIAFSTKKDRAKKKQQRQNRKRGHKQ